jgi:hypothetical protein
MLSADMKECASGVIDLKHIKLKTGKDLIYYLYNRQLREGADVLGLLGLADQYDMQGSVAHPEDFNVQIQILLPIYIVFTQKKKLQIVK